MNGSVGIRDAALIIVDGTGTITDANEQAEVLFGRRSLVGVAVDEVLPPDADGDRPRAGPTRARGPEGTEFPIIANAVDLGDRTVYGIVDLRDPDAVRRAFAPDTSLPSRLVDALDVGIVVQYGGEIVSANAAAARTLGLSLDALLGRTSIDPRWRSVREDGSPFPGEEHPAMVALRTGRPALAVMGVHTPDGDLHWIDVDAKPLIGRDGNTVATFTHFVDITAQRRADDERTTLLVRYESLLADASDAVLLVAPDGTIAYAGPSSAHALGRPAGGLEGTNLLELASTGDRPDLARALEQCATQPAARTATTVGIDAPTGRIRWFEVRIRNAVDLPEVGALVVTLTDVHERVEAVERLRTVNEELQERLAERDEEHRVDHELATATELLGHCEHEFETEGVVWTAATAVFPDVPVTFLRARAGVSALTVVGSTRGGGCEVDADECWAMRTHHVHESRPPDGLACRHLPEDAGPTICIPLGPTTRPYGLIVVAADDTHAVHGRAFADRLGPFLTRPVVTSA